MKGACVAGLLLAAWIVPTALAAQARAGSPEPTAGARAGAIEETVAGAERCSRASYVVGRGIRPEPASMWAFDAVVACPDAGAALAAGIRAVRRSSDMLALAPLVDNARRVRDANVYQAALEVADDRAAAPAARASAFAVLADLKYPGRFPPYAVLVRELDARRNGATGDAGTAAAHACDGLYHTSAPARTVGKAPPPDYQHRIAVLAMEAARDESAPEAVRLLASCSL